MSAPGFTAESALYRSRAYYSAGVSAPRTAGESIAPAFWEEIGEFFSDVGKAVVGPACRAGCWGAGGALASGCTAGSVGAGAAACAFAAGALASACSDSCPD
jgi:hypothetical protein